MAPGAPLLPRVEGYAPVLAVDVPARSNPWDGEVLAGGSMLVYRNDLLTQTHTITGYQGSSGAEIWNGAGEGWLNCWDGAPVVCESTVYRQGVRAASDAQIISIEDGASTRVHVGEPGTFAFVGTYDGVAYFMTWDGTSSVHMTGFDATGSPVRDTNLRIAAPEESDADEITSVMAGAFARVSLPAELPFLFSFEKNTVAAWNAGEACVGLKDGAVCTDNADSAAPFTGYGPDGVAWQVDMPRVRLMDSADSERLSLASAQTLLAKLARSADSDSGSAHYVVATQDSLGVVSIRGGRLSFPDGRKLDMGEATVSSIDLTHPTALVRLRVVGEPVGEGGGNTLNHSVVITPDGNVAASLNDAVAAELLSSTRQATMSLAPFTFEWSGDFLVFTDAVDGVVGVYEDA